MTKDLKFKINYMHDNSLRFSLCNDKMVDLWAIIKQNVIKNIDTHTIFADFQRHILTNS